MCGLAAPQLDMGAGPNGARGGAGSSRRWYVAGAALVVLIVFLLAPRLRPAGSSSFVIPAPAPAAGNPSAVDLSSMTPEEAAIRLFNRVMTSVEAGDTAGARAFAPMALSAYDRVETLDADAHYHIALLHFANEDPASARQEADAILGLTPTHLFGFYVAAQAELAMGNPELALPHFRRILEHYDAEVASGRTEYDDHSEVVLTLREEAVSALAAAP